MLDEDNEYLFRFYKKKEYKTKLIELLEYYKFHNEIPRIFATPISELINKRYD